MNRLLTLMLVAAFLYPLAADAVTKSSSKDYAARGVSISLHDPIGSVYREGEEVGFSIRTDKDAYVVVFNVDTEGFVHLLYPAAGGNIQKFSPDRVYELPVDPGESLVVGGPQGLEFVFAVAVEDRGAINEDELHFLSRNETLPDERKFRITGDPFLAANRIMSQLVRPASLRRDATVSFTYFYVGEAVDFPRYLCEDCFENDRDPYAAGMPAYVAGADFAQTDGLVYPLRAGFVRESAAASATISAPAAAETRSEVTNVYVSYYPRWNDGFYSTSWWYLDPWYWNVWYYDPWYASSSSFYFGVGWNWGWWGWGAYHYRYFPYYYAGPYYAYRPGWGYYSAYPNYWYGGWYYPRTPERWRTYGVADKGRYRTSTLHTAMNQRVKRDFGLSQHAAKPFGPDDRRVAGTKMPGDDRSVRFLEDRRTPRSIEPRVIRSKPTGPPTETRSVLPRDSREIRSQKAPYREQRVITRPQVITRPPAGGDRRTIERRNVERRPGEFDGRAGEIRRPETGRTPESRVTPNVIRQRPESRGAYVPNVRRGGPERSAPPRTTGGSSSGRSSSSSSKSGSSSKDSSRERR
jgi:hypothetical protein